MNNLSSLLNFIGTKMTQDISVKEHVSVDGWDVKKYYDGTFEAIRSSSSGATGTMTQLGSSGIYYSVPAELLFPSIGIETITSVVAKCSPPENYLMDMIINRLTNSSVYLVYLRYGSNTAVNGITWCVRLTGTWR